MKRLSILGSTGSIGTQTLDVVRNHPESFCVAALAAGGRRMELLKEQIREFAPKLVAVYDEAAAAALRADASLPESEIVCGMDGLLAAASLPEADTVVTALVGMIGIEPTVAAIRAGKQIALANKETLVCAGQLIRALAAEKQVEIVPVDSEHCAIFQCLQGVRRDQLKRILLTASGGAFRGKSEEELRHVTVEQALRNPNWDMGPKVTLDSASLMNKALELIEARWLFDCENISPIIQPTSIVHSLIELQDGTVLAQLGVPDMRLPIEVALFYPERGRQITKPLDLCSCGPICFEEIKPPFTRPIEMARFALSRGGLYPAVFNAAGELAVRAFMERRIGFLDIYGLVWQALSDYDRQGAHGKSYTLEEVLAVRTETEKTLKGVF